MKTPSQFKKIIVATALAGLAGCGTTTKQDSVAPVQTATATAEASVDRNYASAADVGDAEMENHFQAIMTSAVPDRALIDYVGQLYHLLIEANKSIEVFSHDLDGQLAQKAADQNYKPKELLENASYVRLTKMWKLKEQYISELSYFYFRLLEIRVQKDEAGHPTADSRKARAIHRNLEKYLAFTQDSQRVELQELMERLREVFTVFVKDLREAAHNKNPSAPVVSDNDASEKLSFEKALFQSPADMQAYIKAHHVQTIPAPTSKEMKDRQRFIDMVEKDLDKLPEPTADNREPQSVTPQILQDNSCSPGRKLCVSAGDLGNIIGSSLPKGAWAFTFDDGPAAKSTSDMMDLVHNYSDSVNPHGKATFFQLAKNVRSYPQWVQKAFDYGFPVENHSFTHADLHSVKTDRHHEIVDADAVLTTEYHKVDPTYKIQYFRCPYGSCYAPKVPEARDMIAKLGEIHVYWRIDSLDWKLLNGPKIADLVEKQIQLMDHGVILMHDIHPTTVDAMRLVLPWLKDQNDNKGKHYKMVTIPEAVDLINGTTTAATK